MLNPSIDLGRLKTLASILMRHGFGDVVHRLGLRRVLARAGEMLPMAHPQARIEVPASVRMRQALEEMGPCFVKLGQVMATCLDLFPPDWIAEFSRLQAAAPSVPFESIRAEMREALGESAESAFLSLDPVPLAAASIAQVHRAQLRDGREVVVKVRRPGIRPIIESDLRLLQLAARKIEARFPQLRRFHPAKVVRQFKISITRELDLAAECRNAERIGARFRDDPRLYVPTVHWSCTNERMNVQDFVDGIPAGDIAALDAAGIDRRSVARKGAQLVLQMLLRDGFFHADPHAGNVFVLVDGRIALIDFGMAGRLTPTRRAEVVRLLFGLVERDTERVTEVLLDWAGDAEANTDELADDVDAFVDRYHGVPLGQLNLAAMLLDVTNLLREHRLSLPPDLALLIKCCITLDGLGRKLDPDFDMARQARPFLRRALSAQYGPRQAARRASRVADDVLRLVASAPRDLRQLLRAIRHGRANVHVEIEALGEFSKQVSHAANRLTGSLVIGALIIGSSIAMTVEGGPTLMGLPLFGLLGFVGAALAGTWLLWWIMRSGGGR